MRRIHLVPEISEANGVYAVARMLCGQQDALQLAGTDFDPAEFDEVWVHGMWLPREWRSCRRALRGDVRLVRMPHGSLSPIYLTRQSALKKRLVSPIERHLFAQCDRIAVTGSWEEEWCRQWGLKGPFETIDVKQFFPLEHQALPPPLHTPLRLLYLGRRHPLKGLHWLEQAVDQLHRDGGAIELRMATNAFGAAKQDLLDWCDYVMLPTMSENFGLVVAEALANNRRAIVTDGAPAWSGNAYAGRLIYLDGFCAASDQYKVELLKHGINLGNPSA